MKPRTTPRPSDHPLHPYFAPLCARRGYKMAVVAVAHRLCRIMFGMLRDGRGFEVSRFAVERTLRAHRRAPLSPHARHARSEVGGGRGIIDTSAPFAVVKARSLIDARTKAADQDPEFSRRLSDGITVPRRLDEAEVVPAG